MFRATNTPKQLPLGEAANTPTPCSALQKFGMAFLNRFECCQLDSPILEKITFIDTPGVLSGEKQRTGRAYDFPEVVEWFAQVGPV